MKKIFLFFLASLFLSSHLQFPMDSGSVSKAFAKPDPAAGVGFPEKQIQISNCHKCAKIEKLANPLKLFTCGHTLHLHCQNNFKSHELTIRNCSLCTPLSLETRPTELATQPIIAPESINPPSALVNSESVTALETLAQIHTQEETQRIQVGAAQASEIVFCAICRENIDPESVTLRPQMLPCNHAFHKFCVNHWFRHSGARTCPICRIEVPENKAIIIGRRIARYTPPIMMLIAVNYTTLKASYFVNSILTKSLIRYYGNLERETFISPAILVASSSIASIRIQKKLISFINSKGIQLLDRIRGRTLAEDEIQAMQFFTESLNSINEFVQYYSAFSDLVHKVLHNRQILKFQTYLERLANNIEE